MGLLAAAVFLGSAILGGFVRSGPHPLGIAIVAIPGLVASASLAGLVLFGILRSGRW
jgi:hypothetical protein